MFRVVSKLVYEHKVVGARIVLDDFEGLDKFYDIGLDVINDFGVDLGDAKEVELQKGRLDTEEEKYTIYLTAEELESGRQVKELIEDDRIDYNMVVDILTKQDKQSESTNSESEPNEPVFIRVIGFEEVTGDKENINFILVSFEGYDKTEVERYEDKYGFWRSSSGYIKLKESEFNSLPLSKYLNETLKVSFLDSKTGTIYGMELEAPDFTVDFEFTTADSVSNIGDYTKDLVEKFPTIVAREE